MGDMHWPLRSGESCGIWDPARDRVAVVIRGVVYRSKGASEHTHYTIHTAGVHANMYACMHVLGTCA